MPYDSNGITAKYDSTRRKVIIAQDGNDIFMDPNEFREMVREMENDLWGVDE